MLLVNTLLRFLCVGCLLFSCVIQAHVVEPQQKVNLYLNWHHQFEFAGYYAAKHKGFYSALGLDVEIHELDQNQSIKNQVLAAEGNYGVDYSQIVLAHMQGEPVVMLANILKHSPHMLVVRPDIRSPKDLIGKRIMAVPGELSDAGMATMLRQFSISDEQYSQIPHTFNIDAFASGGVDAMTVYTSNQLYELDQRGVRYNLLNPNNYAGLLYSGNLFTSEREATQHTDRASKFLQATLQGWAYALDHPEEIIRLLAEEYETGKTLPALQFEAAEIRKAILPNVYTLGSINEDRLKQISTIYLDLDFPVSRTLDLSTFVFSAEKVTPPLLLSEEEIAFLESQPTLRVHNESNWPPLNFNLDGVPAGYSIDYMNLVAEKLGLHVEYVSGYEWADFMRMLKDGQIDVMLNIVETESRAKNFLFTPPYLSASSGIYVRSGSASESIKGMGDLRGKRVAVPKGFFIEELLTRHYPDIERVAYRDSVASMEAVAVGDADAIIGRTGVINYLAEKHFISNLALVSIVDDPLFTSQMRIAVNKDNALLRDILAKGIAAVSEDDIVVLRRKWGQPRVNTPIGLTLDERQYLQEKGSIKLCIDPKWMPFEARDATGQHVGMAADYFALFASYLGTSFDVLRVDSWADALAAAKQRECDLVSLLSSTPSRSEYLNFTSPVLTIPYVIATRKETLYIEDISQVMDEKIGIVEGYSIYEKLKKAYPNAQFVPVGTLEEGLLKVESGSLFGVIDSVASIGYGIRELGLPGVAITGRLDLRRELSVGVRNDDPELLGIMQKAVAHLSPNDHQNIRSRWAPVEYIKSVDYTLVLIILAVSSALVLFFIYRHYVLKRYNQQIEKAHEELLRKNLELEEISVTDSLTGVFNRVKINMLLEKELKRVNRYGGTFSLIMMDLDHFKQVNDTFGHPMGDYVLKMTTEVVLSSLRETDTLGRWGGEEFIIICPGIDLLGAKHCAENLRQCMQTTRFGVVEHQLASFGVTAYMEGDSADSILQRVDAALYRAKEQGRNQVASLPY
ncbi:ABC transporter substrate-binding protein [Neptunomonas concharum]|uniref:diguanylate cyclase n=1 Tax=Neptunomonas concharum TaxID=1031538 RepID=A0A5P1R6N0_9GAMM|nr:transporter substrate-binding domain-containing protein [Neptunomonas concharum]QEQ95318.1 transporter substrate-binding domain-containing protein [Neptunomonas concharum]